MKRRLPTILVTFILLMSHVELNAQPFAAGDAHTEAIEHSDDSGPGEVYVQNTFAGEPKWVRGPLVKPRKNQHHPAPQVTARNDQKQPDKQTKKPKPTRPPKEDPKAIFYQKKRWFEGVYYEITGKHLIVTSVGRDQRQQALAIRSLIRSYGTRYVIRLYRSRPAIREIVNAHRQNRRSGHSVEAMTQVISNQIERGVYISNHLRWRAMDVRSRGRGRARLSAIREVAQVVGARVSIEPNHFHVDFV